MNEDIKDVIEQHKLELQKVKIEILFLTLKISTLDETISFLQGLKHDNFISHDISQNKTVENEQPHLYEHANVYEDVNEAFKGFKQKFEQFQLNQLDIQCILNLVKNDYFKK